MTEPIFFKREAGLTIAEIAALTGAKPAPGARLDRRISNIASLDTAGPGDLVFADTAADDALLSGTRAGACLMREPHEETLSPHTSVLLVSDPYAAFVAVARKLFPDSVRPSSLFESIGAAAGALVHPTARLEDGVTIDPGVVVGPRVEIGAGTLLAAGSVIGPDVRIGRHCSIGPGATIVHALIGDRVAIRSGSRVGQDGFGGRSERAGAPVLPHLGRVIIQDGAEIGANSAIDRGELRDTVIGEGAKIDNLVQIGHNVVIGRGCVLRSQVGVGGSVTIGDRAMLGEQVGVAAHIEIGEGVSIPARSGVVVHVPARAQDAAYGSSFQDGGEGQ